MQAASSSSGAQHACSNPTQTGIAASQPASQPASQRRRNNNNSTVKNQADRLLGYYNIQAESKL